MSQSLEICYERIYFNRIVKDCQLEVVMDREWFMNYSTELVEDYFDMDDYDVTDEFIWDDEQDEIDFLDY